MQFNSLFTDGAPRRSSLALTPSPQEKIMEDKHPSKEELIQETETLRKQVADLEKFLRDHDEKEKHLAHLASFPEANPNPVLEVDFAGDLLYLNSAAKNLFPDLESRGIQHPWFQDWKFLRTFAQMAWRIPGRGRSRSARIGLSRGFI